MKNKKVVVSLGGRTQGRTYLSKQRIEQLKANGVHVVVPSKSKTGK